MAVVVDFSDGWLGGLNYFRNLIEAVAERQSFGVEFVVFTGTRVDEKLLSTWPPLEVVRARIFDRLSLSWFARKLHQKYLLADPALQALLELHRIDVLSHSGYLGRRSKIACIGWVPDFQHLHLPDVFRRWDIVRRDAEIARIVTASTSVIVSSLSARSDLLSVAPDAKDKVEVLRFVGEAPEPARLLAKDALQQRYGFQGDYVYLPNQYWSHKNHLTVVRALAALKVSGRRMTVISTGKKADFRRPEFFSKFEAEVARLGLGEEYKMLGIVPYDDVVSLFQHCAFVINPSRFEGWSTTVEEAKAAAKHIVLSDIPVHREQAPASADFFEATNVAQLQELLWRRWTERASLSATAVDRPDAQCNHSARRNAFADQYLGIVQRALIRQLSA